MESEFHENVLRSAIAFKAETGALLLFTPGRIQLYKAGWTPVAMTKSRDSRGWKFNRGGGLLDLRVTAAQVRRHRRLHKLATASGESQLANYEVQCLMRFLDLVPEEIQRELARYHRRTWQLYSFFARCGAPAFEMSNSNRALAFCLANTWVFAPRRVRWEMRRSRTLLRQRRRYIVGTLGFPSTNAAARVLARLTRKCLDINPLLYLRQAMQDEVLLARLMHLDRINPGVTRVISDPFLISHTSQRMLIDVASKRTFDTSSRKLVRLMEDTLAMLGERRRETMVFQDLEHLTTIHDELAEHYRDRKPGLIAAFNKPPLPGVPGRIEPITNTEDLWEESRVMKNCLASPYYTRAVLCGRLYVYRVISPERCSLALERASAGGWRVCELQASGNREPRLDSFIAIQRWLDGLESRSRLPKPALQLPLFPCPQVFLRPHDDEEHD